MFYKQQKESEIFRVPIFPSVAHNRFYFPNMGFVSFFVICLLLGQPLRGLAQTLGFGHRTTSTPISGLDTHNIELGGRVSPKFMSIMLVGSVLTRLAWKTEDPQRIRKFLDQPVFNVTDVGDIYGDGLFLGAGLLGLTAAAKMSNQQGLAAFSSDLSRSLAFASTATWTLKLSVGRRRPSGGPHSFPSGHTAAAFCVAPIIAKHYGWKAAIPAYILAGFTGIARMEDRRHYLSDVCFGAAIGLAAGDAVAGGGGASQLLKYVDIGLNSVGIKIKF